MLASIVRSFAGGSLIDCLGSALEPELVLRIFYQATKAVGHMHAQSPPITHRDIKVCVVVQRFSCLRRILINSYHF